jgi:hypothetical protein
MDQGPCFTVYLGKADDFTREQEKYFDEGMLLRVIILIQA